VQGKFEVSGSSSLKATQPRELEPLVSSDVQQIHTLLKD
jgi:hypothetical protein